jgi:hypothetical protein
MGYRWKDLGPIFPENWETEMMGRLHLHRHSTSTAATASSDSPDSPPPEAPDATVCKNDRV